MRIHLVTSRCRERLYCLVYFVISFIERRRNLRSEGTKLSLLHFYQKNNEGRLAHVGVPSQLGEINLLRSQCLLDSRIGVPVKALPAKCELSKPSLLLLVTMYITSETRDHRDPGIKGKRKD